jgi:hypothetical protein
MKNCGVLVDVAKSLRVLQGHRAEYELADNDRQLVFDFDELHHDASEVSGAML